ncbi:conserved hypothetical protein [Alteracholeplasma palmae J233]|uniref:DUF2357 domain-containing protein n=1 Tax=Alteracholeplasma palmae (strain ATCC 49389 / J233) TaxID=1318466 RepID=U4KRK7_ALTPJ|nr:hypothetical protein [Alteracholeplasma palmae]CCV64251.1 conserved hypothetical protein [Alteracholeplasma palmae J233]
MKRKYDSELFLEKVSNSIEEHELNLDFPEVFYDALTEGSAKRKQRQHFEYKKFDDAWLKNIEAYFPSIDRITRNLKSTLRYESEILPIEKTRKTNPESIRHLTQNTRYIKEINEDDEIIPEKVLNILSEIEYGIYENRFIMTLIFRLKDYLYNRLKVIKEQMHGFKETTFELSNDFSFNHADYELEVNLKAKETIDSNKEDDHNKSVLERTERLYQLVSRLINSEFMQVMKKYKKVKPPIMKTQIILKNPDFRNAYMLWLYLDKTHILDYELQTETKQKRFTQEYYNHLNQSLLVLFSTIFTYSELGSEITDDKLFTSLKKAKEELTYASNLDTNIPIHDIEPQEATEFYLRKARTLFNKHYQQIIDNKNPQQTSVKQVLMEQYKLVDQIYQDYFEINQDSDVFSQLIMYKDPVKAYDEAKTRYDVAKAARQLKEQMYHESLELENKWIDEVNKRQEFAINELQAELTSVTSKQIEEIQKKTKKEETQYEKKLNKDRKVALNKQKVLTDIKYREIKLKYDADLKKYKEKEKLRLQKEKEKLALKLKKEKERLRVKATKEKLRDKEMLQVRKDNKLKAYKEKIDAQKKKVSKNNKQN